VELEIIAIDHLTPWAGDANSQRAGTTISPSITVHFDSPPTPFANSGKRRVKSFLRDQEVRTARFASDCPEAIDPQLIAPFSKLQAVARRNKASGRTRTALLAPTDNRIERDARSTPQLTVVMAREARVPEPLMVRAGGTLSVRSVHDTARRGT
jgi:hypothetical protein